MIDSMMASDYLNIHDDSKATSALRRTRASTKKFMEAQKIELKSIESGHDFHNATYTLDGREHQIKVNDGSIQEVSCSECRGRLILLFQIIKNYFNNLSCRVLRPSTDIAESSQSS